MSTLIVTNVTDTSGGSTNLTVPNTAKAWVNFNGTGTVAIRANFNVSSITDNGTGDYTTNFTTAFTDANYSVCGTSSGAAVNSGSGARALTPKTLNSGSATVINTAGSGLAEDSTIVSVAIFR
jgi:hypothetical protein